MQIIPARIHYTAIKVLRNTSILGRVLMRTYQLRALLTTMQTGTYAGAAERLHLSDSSAVRKQVRALEKELQVPLIERSDGQIRPTTAANALVPHLLRILASESAIHSMLVERRAMRHAPHAS